MTKDMHRALLFLYAETPVHAGADAGLGALDLPIQREVSTKLPIIKGESLKGALREHLRPRLDQALWKKIFGAPPPRSGIAGGALPPGELNVHEAQLVAFPAPAIDGFAWATSPLIRARLRRRAHLAGITWPGTTQAGTSQDSRDGSGAEPAADDVSDDAQCLMTDINAKGSKKLPTRSVVLGPYAFTATGNPDFKSWAAGLAELALPALDEHAFFSKKLAKDIYQVSDAALTAITRECTSVVARVQLGAEDSDGNPSKTVQHGPFYSEYLPSESLLAAMLESPSPDHLDRLADLIGDSVIQVGGDETIGKGLMWCRIIRAGTTPGSPAGADAGSRP
jgi:CRISPR-associated protein Cmr4